MNQRTILIATFIKKNELQYFLEYVYSELNITKEDIFCFNDKNNQNHILITFRLILLDGDRIDLKTILPNSMLVHKRGNAIYTINALNRLIEQESECMAGNIVYETHKINWDDYQGKLIILKNGNLVFIDIERTFLPK